MSFLEVSSGRDVPNDINVIIEIPASGAPVKYEVDKDCGLLNVDRFFLTPMFYPVNYGYIPQTLSEDGDPVDVLVVTPVPLLSGVLIRCRVIGMLNMTDESGIDMKLLAVPIKKLTPIYDNVNKYQDLPSTLLESIEHFFSHYKDLDAGKWVKLDGWAGEARAKDEIMSCIARYQGSQIVF